jgi:hypothetical protein
MPFVYGTSSNYQTFADDLLALVTGISLHEVVSIDDGGSGYVVGDLLTLSGGTSTIAAILEVTEVGGGGEVTAVRIRNAGLYSVAPTDPVAVTGGTGTGAEFNCDFDDNGWSMRRDTNVGGSGQREVIIEGIGSGADEIFVGWRTYEDAGTGARNFELAGMTSFNSGLIWDNQPGISPGRHTATSGGCYVPLASTTITWWVSVTPRRIVFCTRIGTYYGSAHLGLLNPYATSGEWPYPLYIAGSTSNRFHLPTTSDTNNSGIADPRASSASHTGPAQIRRADGSWKAVWNAVGTVTSNTQAATYPYGQASSISFQSNDNWYGTGIGWNTMFSISDVSQSNRLLSTVNSGGALFVLLPVVVLDYNSSGLPLAIFGEMDGVFVFEARGVVVNENRFVQNGAAYIAFQHGSRTANWNRWVMRED